MIIIQKKSNNLKPFFVNSIIGYKKYIKLKIKFKGEKNEHISLRNRLRGLQL